MTSQTWFRSLPEQEIKQEDIDRAMAFYRFIHVDGFGMPTFEHLPVERRLDAMVESRRALRYEMRYQAPWAIKFLIVLGQTRSYNEHSPTVRRLVDLYQALAKFNSWECQKVCFGMIVLAANFLDIKVKNTVALEPDARIGVSLLKVNDLEAILRTHGLLEKKFNRTARG